MVSYVAFLWSLFVPRLFINALVVSYVAFVQSLFVPHFFYRGLRMASISDCAISWVSSLIILQSSCISKMGIAVRFGASCLLKQGELFGVNFLRGELFYNSL